MEQISSADIHTPILCAIFIADSGQKKLITDPTQSF